MPPCIFLFFLCATLNRGGGGGWRQLKDALNSFLVTWSNCDRRWSMLLSVLLFLFENPSPINRQTRSKGLVIFIISRGEKSMLILESGRQRTRWVKEKKQEKRARLQWLTGCLLDRDETFSVCQSKQETLHSTPLDMIILTRTEEAA